MKTAEEVADKIAFSYMMSWPPDCAQKPLFLGPTQYVSVLAQALTQFAADANDYYYEHIALNMAKQARAEGYAEAREDAANTVDGIWELNKNCDPEAALLLEESITAIRALKGKP